MNTTPISPDLEGAPDDETKLALLGLHPEQIALAHQIAGVAPPVVAPTQTADAQPAEVQPRTIAAPNSGPRPITLSSIPSDEGMTADSREAPTLGTPQVAEPSRTMQDQSELSRLRSTGSGIAQFQQRHPIIGGIARVASGIGSSLFPAVAANIPGTDLHHRVLENQAAGDVGEDLAQEKDQATAAETQARTNQANAAAYKDLHPVEKPDKLDNPEAATFDAYVQAGMSPGDAFRQVQKDKTEGAASGKPTPAETQEQNKIAFQGIVGKIDAAGLPTDPKTLDKSLDAALKKGVITKEEHASARSYEAANTTPGTNLTVRVAGQDESNANAIKKMFEGKEVLAHLPDGRRVQMSYADSQAQGIPPERLVALNPKEAQDTRDKAASIDATFKSLDTYRTDFKSAAPGLTSQDRDAMRVLASHTQDGSTAGILGGLIDEIPLAGPLTKYSNKLLDGTMTSDQYKQLSPAGKKLVSDYFTAIIANFANMKNIMGSVGRNPMQLQAEINTIPLPFLDWESASNAFENKRSDISRRSASQPELYMPGK